MREVTFAATQMACSKNSKDNIDKAVNIIESAAKKGANVVFSQNLADLPNYPTGRCGVRQ